MRGLPGEKVRARTRAHALFRHREKMEVVHSFVLTLSSPESLGGLELVVSLKVSR